MSVTSGCACSRAVEIGQGIGYRVDLQHAVLIDEHVGGREVAVEHGMAVAELHAAQQLAKVAFHLQATGPVSTPNVDTHA